MLPLLRLLACLLATLVASAGHAQDVSFTHDGVQADARRYESYLKASWQPGTRQGRELRAEGNRLLAAGKDYRAASRAFAQAAVFDAGDADAWLGLARALLAITSDQSGERYDLPVNASGAAWNAYQRAKAPATKAAALLVLHEAFKRRSFWRAAIDALRASVALAPNAQAQTALERAGGRARLPHRRVQGGQRRRPAAPVHPVQRAAGRRARWTGRSTSRSTARTRRR